MVREHAIKVQQAAQGYRTGWEACRARVRELVEMGLSPVEIVARL